jgi:iron complex outermembrane recepter protein
MRAAHNSPVDIWIARAAVVLATVLLSAAVGRADIPLTGTVIDPSGLGIPGAKLTIVDSATGATRSVATGAAGRYQLPSLPAGQYRLTATCRGFAPYSQELSLDDGAARQLDITLQILPERESITVRTTRPVSGDTAFTGDTAQLLAGLPGVSLYGNGGVSSLPAIHGMADDRVRVKVNGMDLASACANHMNPPLSYIDPSRVGSVQVFAGITPVSMGGDSIGGTISVDSPAPEFAAPGQGSVLRGSASTRYRSAGNGYGADLQAMFARESLSVSYNGALAHAGNYQASRAFKVAGPAAVDRGWLASSEVGSSRYESQNHALDLALRHGNHLLDLMLGVQRIPYQGFPNQRMDMTRNDSLHGNLHYTAQHGWGDLEARVYADRTRHSMDFANDKQFFYGSAATILAPGMPMETKGKMLGALLKAELPLSRRHVLRVGAEGQRYRLDDWWPPSPSVLPPGYAVGGMAPDTFVNVNNGRRDRAGVFAEWNPTWNPHWASLLGIRGETVMMNTGPVHGYNNTQMYNGAPLFPATTFNSRDRKRTDHNLDVTALGRYAPGATLSFEAGYAMKTRSPNIYERYAWSTNTMAMEMVNLAGDGNYYVGNLDLKPEVAHTVSATAEWHSSAKERRGLAVTPYYTGIHNYIDARRCPATVCGTSAAVKASATAASGFVYLQLVNQSAELYGVDVSGHASLAQAKGYGSISATGTLSIVRGKNRTTDDNLYNIMPANALLAIAHTVGSLTTSLEWQLVGGKKNLSRVRNEIRTGDYGLVHLRTSYGWKKARLDVGVENLLDQFYAPPLAGAYVGQGPTMSGSTMPWGIPIAGMERSLYARLTLGFRSR